MSQLVSSSENVGQELFTPPPSSQSTHYPTGPNINNLIVSWIDLMKH